MAPTRRTSIPPNNPTYPIPSKNAPSTARPAPSPGTTKGQIPIQTSRRPPTPTGPTRPQDVKPPEDPANPKPIFGSPYAFGEFGEKEQERAFVFGLFKDKLDAYREHLLIPAWVKHNQPPLRKADVVLFLMDDEGKETERFEETEILSDLAWVYANGKGPYTFSNGKINRAKIAEKLNVDPVLLRWLEGNDQFGEMIEHIKLRTGMADERFRRDAYRRLLDKMLETMELRLSIPLGMPGSLAAEDFKKVSSEFRELTKLMQEDAKGFVQHQKVEHSGSLSVDIRLSTLEIAGVLEHLEAGPRAQLEREILTNAEAIVRSLADSAMR